MKAHEDDAVLALRLGQAVNSLVAAFRFTVQGPAATSPAEHGDQLMSFLVASAFMHEARLVWSGKFTRVKRLALVGGASESEFDSVNAMMQGPLGTQLANLRNQLVFHWDDDRFRDAVRSEQRTSVVLAEGSGKSTGGTFYRGSMDAVLASLFEDVTDPAKAALAFRQLAEQMSDAYRQLIRRRQ